MTTPIIDDFDELQRLLAEASNLASITGAAGGHGRFQGGAGTGSGDTANAGGLPGFDTGEPGQPGQPGGRGYGAGGRGGQVVHSLDSFGGTGGTGGGGGAPGYSGAESGSYAVGDGAAIAGGKGGDGGNGYNSPSSSAPGNGGGGGDAGGGGDGFYGVDFFLNNEGSVTGGEGGFGGLGGFGLLRPATGGDGGGGGDGGAGVVGAGFGVMNTGVIAGGDGGASGIPLSPGRDARDAGDGGAGVTGTDFQLINIWTIAGGDAVKSDGSPGSGGAGVFGTDFIVLNAGDVTGGNGGSGQSAPAAPDGAEGVSGGRVYGKGDRGIDGQAGGNGTAGDGGHEGGTGGLGIGGLGFALINEGMINGGAGGQGSDGGNGGSGGTGGAGGRGANGGVIDHETVSNEARGGDGGNGAAGGDGATGGIGGTGGAGGSGVEGADFSLINTGAITGGAGGAGGAGGRGGTGGWGGMGGTGGAYKFTDGGTGGDAGDGGNGGAGGAGGTGGAGVSGSGFTLANIGTVTGGAGGLAGDGGAGGQGGAGGAGGLFMNYRDIWPPEDFYQPSGFANGGWGGDGGDGGMGGLGGWDVGDAGAGVSGSDFTLTNVGTIKGGDGVGDTAQLGFAGAGGNGGDGGDKIPGPPVNGSAGDPGLQFDIGALVFYGRAGAGVVATGNAHVVNGGTIAGGTATITGTSLIRQANAVEFSGGGNELTLAAGYAFVGDVVSTSGTTNGGDALYLGGCGCTAATFDVGQLGVTYRGFTTLGLTGGYWIVNGSNTSGLGWTVTNGVLELAGGAQSGDVTVGTGGTLGGNGTAGIVMVQAGGTVAAGGSAGILETGDIAFEEGSIFAVEIGGSMAGIDGYDQLQVTGTVSIGTDVKLVLSRLGAFEPSAGEYVIVDNDGDDAVVGHFAGRADGRTFLAGGRAFTIDYQGGDGNDIVLTAGGYFVGTAGDDVLVGSSAGDVLNGGRGADMMSGGLGDDFYYVDNAGDVVLEAAGEGRDRVYASVDFTLTAGQEIEILRATAGRSPLSLTGNELDNRIIGRAGDDVLSGGDGNDVLVGGRGADRMIGGDGNDIYRVHDAGDIVVEAADGGIDMVRTTLSTFTLGDEVENLRFVGIGDFEGIGNELDNKLRGGSGNDTLYGNAGKDVLIGGRGADTMIGGDGNDIYRVHDAGDVVVEAADGGIDTVRTTLSTFTLGDEVENLRFVGTGDFEGIGNELDNTLRGGAGNDTLYGDAGNDVLIGGAGVDVMIGGAGNDTYYVDNADDVVFELAGGGTDTVYASVDYILGDSVEVEVLRVRGIEGRSLTANEFANTLIGGIGNDILDGGVGNDTLRGGTGNDTLIGGAGADEMAGGAGADTFVFRDVSHSTYGARDTITDFRVGEDRLDFLELGGAGFNALVSVTAAPVTIDAYSMVAFVSGGNTVLYLNDTASAQAADGASMEIFLKGVTGLTDADLGYNLLA